MTTSSIDLDRSLDELLGPDPGDRLPDRVVAAAFERTARTEQRRGVRVLGRSRSHMAPMLRLLAAAAILALAVGGATFVGGQRNAVIVPPTAPPAATPTGASTPSPSPSATPEPLPSYTPPPLTSRFESPYGFSVTTPDGYQRFPATESWRPGTELTLVSSSLERMTSADNLVTLGAASIELDRQLSSADWLQEFGTYPGAPVTGEVGCMERPPVWQNVTVDGEPAFAMHEPCGAFWLVVAKDGRGYVFEWRVLVDDVPYLMAPYETLIAAVRETIRLTPSTARSAAPAPGPSS